MANSATKTRVAILGGGVGAISAAWGLLSQPDGADQYEITIYQMGWRLGGKGASGRNMTADKGKRIEEHGLHVWMGCYDNAFRLINNVYDECRRLNLTPSTPFPAATDAFKPHDLVTIFEHIDGAYLPWSVDFPTNSATPGTGGVLLTPWQYVQMILNWMRDQVAEFAHPAVTKALAAQPVHPTPGSVTRLLQSSATNVHDDWLASAAAIADSMDTDVLSHKAYAHSGILWILNHLMEALWDELRSKISGNTKLRRLWIMLNLGAAIARGLIQSGAIFHGFDPEDEYEFRQWLAKYGADQMSAWSAPVKALYDLVFAYQRGDDDSPNIAAGCALRTMFRIIATYKQAFCFKMQAGMGDIVFTPAYELLKHQGVQFKFFHRVRNLGLSADQQSIETIEMDVQAELTDSQSAAGGYDPLIDVQRNGTTLRCWPSTPLYDQLKQGDALQEQDVNLESSWSDWVPPATLRLHRGADEDGFDLVICGISIAGLPYCCSELVAASNRWTEMVDNVQTVQTEACQVWMDHSADQMGWTHDQRILFGSFPWSGADMSQVETQEEWPTGLVRNVTYYCRQLPDADPIPAPETDPDFPNQQKALVKEHALKFLNTQLAPIWPDGTEGNGIRWEWVVDPDDGEGEARFDSQYWRANIDPSERYVLSVKNATEFRIPSDDSGFSNLFLAGDWTRNGLNVGCVEAAVIAGLQVSRKISGHPQIIVGETDLTL